MHNLIGSGLRLMVSSMGRVENPLLPACHSFRGRYFYRERVMEMDAILLLDLVHRIVNSSPNASFPVI